ncbi:sigma-70 family RNA polymerase sigma factor [Mangrovibacillus cuniculi]|uniref:Sigma-70 family RNA polymerase sigma factor n=1 Tax=Mangrovibacillus cuniculi TaxID=2593652 RepID=A0A7S8CCT7_9BACI|nr:sigma-70 family RNA polymerase sigma factor [Mangrovibacillus cuniculi]QPC47625.1 sigma-70 family RNA polymerase sigma factor [Mangrovibacillus cuniculi]
MEQETIVLIKQAKSGNNQAFEQVMRLHQTRLYKIAFTYFHNEHDAIEAVQETTYRAYKQIKKLRDPAHISAWLTRILFNYCHDEFRKRQKLVVTEKVNGEAQVDDNSISYDIRSAVLSLEEPYKHVITLRYFHDLPVEEIAYIMDRPKGTIKTWIRKGLSTLKGELTEEGESLREKHS